MSPAASDGDAGVRAVLERFESELDPARPTRSPGIEIIGFGEVSTVFSLARVPGRVCKRMAGFRDVEAARRYAALVQRYAEWLGAGGVRAADTEVVLVERRARAPVVYLLQARLDPAGFGNQILRHGSESLLVDCLERVLAGIGGLLRSNRERDDGRAVTVDAQLSNWHFAREPGRIGDPLLVDVGTPFVRRDGVDEIGPELFLAAVPPGIRSYYRRARAVERYLDAFFDARSLLVDALANFHKEGRLDRIPLALERVNRWLLEEARDLGGAPIHREEVERYYRDDAKTLELYLKARRVDRFVRTRLLRRRYDFILPGAIRR